MSESKSDLNKHGNHVGEFTQGVGGWAEYTVNMTKTGDTIRHDVTVPPGKVIPVIFLPGVMGSNLRMSKKRQNELDLADNRSWRPDDLMSKGGKAGVATQTGFGGRYSDASPKQRQLIFDQNETEVEYYHYTESQGRFDPGGKETVESDVRHQNIPNNLSAIPPLMGSHGVLASSRFQKNKQTPAQIARWRGWSEVLFDGAYGEMLKTAERLLNNIAKNGNLSFYWNANPTYKGQAVPTIDNKITSLLWKGPTAFGGKSGKAITESDLMKIAPCWYPVHAMGYNFLQSNGISAKIIADRVRGMVKGYQKRGFKCDEVIIVTHSMGGLLARALIHPAYGNLLNDKSLKILGIYHNVMPTLGAAGAYKRMRFGFQEREGRLAELEASVIAVDGMHATAILANAPAPLEMMPGRGYGANWLRVVDWLGTPVGSWPKQNESPLESIYLQPEKAWWRLLNPLWVNPANVMAEQGGGLYGVHERISDAADFLCSIEKTFHPRTYASYCASPERMSYGEVIFRIVDCAPGGRDAATSASLPDPETWTLLFDDAKSQLKVQAGNKVLTLKLLPASAAGDETVPSDRSARKIAGTLFEHGCDGAGYEHQNSYSDPQVLASMLHSIVQIAKTAKWGTP